jgi:hypothetical protein
MRMHVKRILLLHACPPRGCVGTAWRVSARSSPAYDTRKRRQVVALFFAVETLYLMTIFFTPGFVRREAAAAQQQASVGAGPDGERVAEKGLCKKCNTVKPPRAHHCSICRRYGVPSLAPSLALSVSPALSLSLAHVSLASFCARVRYLSRSLSRALSLCPARALPLSCSPARLKAHMSSCTPQGTHELPVV